MPETPLDKKDARSLAHHPLARQMSDKTISVQDALDLSLVKLQEMGLAAQVAYGGVPPEFDRVGEKLQEARFWMQLVQAVLDDMRSRPQRGVGAASGIVVAGADALKDLER